MVEVQKLVVQSGPLELGECKFETGWAPLFHVPAAGPRNRENERRVGL